MDFFYTDAFGFGEPQDGDAGKDAYAQLSDLCTALVIAEEGSLVPLEPVGNTILTALNSEETSGDVRVMAARALALLLEKFCFSFKLFKKKNTQAVTVCLQHVFSLVTARTSALTFTKTTRSELIEEILRCLTHGCGSTLPVVQKMMPSVEAQLAFCEAAADGSKWASCKVLQHCALLTRRGLESAANEVRVVELLRRHLELLVQLDMDYEWDELLRTVIEGIVMVRVWTSFGRVDPASRDPSRHRKRKTRETDAPLSHPASASVPIAMSLMALCERVCRSQTAQSRKELVIACTALTLSAREICTDTTVEQRCRLLSCLLNLVDKEVDSPLDFSNPFAPKKTAASDDTADDAFKALPNLQWQVPAIPWTAMVVVAKITGCEPPLKGSYVWAWRGDGDAYYWYRQKEREAMTDALFRGQRSVPLKSGTHKADLVTLLDRKVRTEMCTRIHLQPIPFAVTYNGARLEVSERAGADVLSRRDLLPTEVIFRSLSALSFGHTAMATFAKAVQLHVVCLGGPRAIPEASEAVLRTYTVDHNAAEVESLAATLLRDDPSWAPVLLAAGVAEAIEHPLPALATSVPRLVGRKGVTAAEHNRKRRRSASPSPLVSNARRSPVVSLIRDSPAVKGDATLVAPVAEPMRLPPHNNFAEMLEHASSTHELVDLLAALSNSTDSGEEIRGKVSVNGLYAAMRSPPTSTPSSSAPLQDLPAKTSPAGQRLSAAVRMYTLKALGALTMAGHQGLPLCTRLEGEARPLSVTICPPQAHGLSQSPDAATAGAHGRNDGQCAAGHPLRIHFSTTWRCNVCSESTAYGAWSCRECDYDLCYRCAERMLHRIEVNCTACVGDVVQAWIARSRDGDTDSGAQTTVLDASTGTPTSTHVGYAAFLYTSHNVLSAVLPASVLARAGTTVHLGPVVGTCPCGVSCPDDFSPGRELVDDRGGAPACAWWTLLEQFGGEIAGESTVCRAIVELLETFATDIFLLGVSGLPAAARHLLTAISSHLPVDLKRRVAHFLTVGCRRFGLQHIQDSGDMLLRGSVLGEVESNGLASRFTVPRANIDSGTLMSTLYTTFVKPIPLRNKVEFRFKDEEGTGSGPTQELYTELSTHVAQHKELWHVEDDGVRIPFPNCTRIYVREWFVIGAACGRAFVDDYQIRVDLVPAAWQLIWDTHGAIDAVTCSDSPALWGLFRLLQPAMARSFEQLRSDFNTDDALAALGLDHEDGTPLTLGTREAYIQSQVQQSLSVGLQNLRSFVMGLLTSVDLNAFFLLSAEQLSRVLCGSFEESDAPLFTEDELRAVTIGAHGYSTGCKEVDMFVTIVGNLDRQHQVYFVEFLTGSVYLPAGGLKGLKGKITVVRKDMEGNGEQTLPSCNTCFLYLKLPPYSSTEIMTRRLVTAIVEGRKNFSLS